jgi:hypothetical protein
MLHLMMFPFNYGMVLIPIGFTIALDMHQNDERNEGVQMEVKFDVSLNFHPTKFEGTLKATNNFGAAIASGSVDVHIFIKIIMPPIDPSVMGFFNATINTDKVPMVEIDACIFG